MAPRLTLDSACAAAKDWSNYRGFPLAHKKWSICTPPIHPTPSTSGRTFAPTTLPLPCPLKAPRLTGQPLVDLPISRLPPHGARHFRPPIPASLCPALHHRPAAGTPMPSPDDERPEHQPLLPLTRKRSRPSSTHAGAKVSLRPPHPPVYPPLGPRHQRSRQTRPTCAWPPQHFPRPHLPHRGRRRPSVQPPTKRHRNRGIYPRICLSGAYQRGAS